MTISTALARHSASRALRRAGRARLLEDRALRRLIADAPTRESAHELASLLAHR